MRLWPFRRRTARRQQGPRPNRSTRPSRRTHRRWTWVRPVGKFIASIAVIGLVVWGAFAGYRSAAPLVVQWLAIKTVIVVGNNQVPRSEVLEHLKLEQGATLLSITPKRLERHLEAHPWIKRADVRRVPPHVLEVHIVERHAAAVLKSPSMTLLLDEEGHALSTLTEATEPALPILVGLNPKRLLNGEEELIKTAQKGIEVAGMLARAFDGRPEVDVANAENVVAYVQGLRLQFGHASFEEKWDLYRKLESHVVGAAGGERTDGRSEIDLRYPGKVIVRERG